MLLPEIGFLEPETQIDQLKGPSKILFKSRFLHDGEITLYARPLGEGGVGVI
jgi:hypothetical protein